MLYYNSQHIAGVYYNMKKMENVSVGLSLIGLTLIELGLGMQLVASPINVEVDDAMSYNYLMKNTNDFTKSIDSYIYTDNQNDDCLDNEEVTEVLKVSETGDVIVNDTYTVTLDEKVEDALEGNINNTQSSLISDNNILTITDDNTSLLVDDSVDTIDNASIVFNSENASQNEEEAVLLAVNTSEIELFHDEAKPFEQLEIIYSTTAPTNSDVIATLTGLSEGMIITNNGGANSITFTDNGSFTFELIDQAGNVGVIVATVNNIDKISPTANVIYDKLDFTNGDVVATLTDFSEDIVILNNEGKSSVTFTDNGSFTFEFMDQVGNIGTAVAIVNNIDKVAPTAQLKYEKIENDKVIVTVINPSEEITFSSGNGIYEFNKNGIYEIIFYDRALNVGKVVATITDLGKKPNINVNNDHNKNNIASVNVEKSNIVSSLEETVNQTNIDIQPDNKEEVVEENYDDKVEIPNNKVDKKVDKNYQKNERTNGNNPDSLANNEKGYIAFFVSMVIVSVFVSVQFVFKR